MEIIHVEELDRHLSKAAHHKAPTITVGEGEIFGILGPDGAAHQTLINVITTLLFPETRDGESLKYNIFSKRKELRGNIGVVFPYQVTDPKKTGRENLLFHADLHGIPKPLQLPRIAKVLHLVNLTHMADMPVEVYSPESKRLIEIARAIINEPAVLFLDMPTDRLDGSARVRLWEYIRGINMEMQMTIVIATNSLEEAAHLCSRVEVIDGDSVVVIETPSRLQEMLGENVIFVDGMDCRCDI